MQEINLTKGQIALVDDAEMILGLAFVCLVCWWFISTPRVEESLESGVGRIMGKDEHQPAPLLSGSILNGT